MLGLPPPTDVRKAIPKDAFFSSKNIKGRERERFDKEIHSLTIRSLISPESVNLDKGAVVSAIYVMEVQLNVQECDERNLMLLDKLGHKTVYVLTYGDQARLAVVEDIVFKTEWGPLSDLVLVLEGLNLDEAWANIVRRIGSLPEDTPLRGTVEAAKLRRRYDSEIAELDRKFNREKQNHERRRLYSEIQRLKRERDAIPECIDENIEVPDAEQPEEIIRKGVSVTRRIRDVVQPPGGYIDPRSLKETKFDDGVKLGEENIPAQIVGLAVDYLTRLSMGATLQEAFFPSIYGGMIAGKPLEVAEYMAGIRGLDDESIENACRTCMFDSYYRAGRAPRTDPEFTFVNHQTCENIRTMIERSRRFIQLYGPITEYGPKFPGGYTDTVSKGDGDFLTRDTLWDFKVSKNLPTKEQTLQLAMYLIMGKHSTNDNFRTVKNIGLFNPRLNVVYTLNISEISPETLRRIEREVIGYAETECIKW